MRQLFVGNSVTLGTVGALVATAPGDFGVGSGEADPVLDGAGGVEGVDVEHPAGTTNAAAASRLPSPRLKLTPTH
jgi:hypothetical protein